MKNSKGFALVPFLVILALTAVGVYFYVSQKSFPYLVKNPSPTASVDTAGWKTYRNELFEFEIGHPQNWTLDSSVMDTNIDIESGLNRGGAYVTIYPPDYNNRKFVKKIELVFTKTLFKNTVEIVQKEKESFSSTKLIAGNTWAIGNVPKGGPGADAPAYALIRGKLRVGIYAWGFEEERDKVDQILSTLKFMR